MISETMVDASASSPATAIDGLRTSTRSAMKSTIRCTTQNTMVAPRIAPAPAEKSLSTAADRMMPAAIPTSDASSLIPQRASTARAYSVAAAGTRGQRWPVSRP